MPEITARSGSSSVVDETLCTNMAPSARLSTMSVKVPPMSTAISAAPIGHDRSFASQPL